MTEVISDITFVYQDYPLVSSTCYVDFNASKHMTSWKDLFSSLYDNAHPGQVWLGDDTSHDIEGKGNVHVWLGKNNYQLKVVFNEIKLIKNVLSISQMIKKNMKVEFDTMKGEKVCFIHDNSKGCQIVAKEKGFGRIFFLDVVASNN